MSIQTVIMAAGQGTRMRSSTPKVLHPILGKPMLWYSLRAAQTVSDDLPVVVVGHQAERVRRFAEGQARFAVQEQQLGTAHAVEQARPLLAGQAETILVTSADMPLISAETLHSLAEAQQAHPGPMTMLVAESDSPRGFGRVVRDDGGFVRAIVEEADATPEELAIRLLNVGVYAFEAAWLWDALRRVPLSPKGEYYVTALVELAVRDGLNVQALTLANPEESIGVNTRVHLAEAAAAMQRRINTRWMLAGVTLLDPATTYIEPEVVIGRDTLVWPNTHLRGGTTIGQGCELGPNTYILDTQIGNRCRVFASVLEHAIVEDEVDIGPFGHLRKGAHLARGVHMGNFGEVKNSYLGPGSKMGHFSYLGDATLGANVNVGAGTITCNYDGERKNPTRIGDNAFIGSDTMLVAPLVLGENARTGAGAVVTKDVPSNSLAVGMPARVIRKFEKP